MEILEQGFEEFFRTAAKENPLKAEYLLPIYIGQLLREGKVTVQVLETRDKWFGVTYREDKPAVVESFRKLIADGVYSVPLFG
ncbi:MAG: nucleotidyltransferase, partial [Oscillospiraceae bacterium]|nr:nucleotidyltransferase [Oscillospiraceae bacterium]